MSAFRLPYSMDSPASDWMTARFGWRTISSACKALRLVLGPVGLAHGEIVVQIQPRGQHHARRKQGHQRARAGYWFCS